MCSLHQGITPYEVHEDTVAAQVEGASSISMVQRSAAESKLDRETLKGDVHALETIDRILTD